MKMNDKDLGIFDNAIGTMRLSEKEFWKAGTLAMKLAISHVLEGGNISTVNKVVQAGTSNRRRDLFKFACTFLAFESDKKSMKFIKKSGNPKLVTRKAELYSEWLAKKQTIKTWIDTASVKVDKILTAEQKLARAKSAIHKATEQGIKPIQMLELLAVEYHISFTDLLEILTAYINVPVDVPELKAA